MPSFNPLLTTKTLLKILHEVFYTKREECKCSSYILQEVERGSRIPILS